MGEGINKKVYITRTKLQIQEPGLRGEVRPLGKEARERMGQKQLDTHNSKREGPLERCLSG